MNTEALCREALSLSLQERARLADQLFASLESAATMRLPDDMRISTRLAVSEADFERIVQRLTADEMPTNALRELMRG